MFMGLDLHIILAGETPPDFSFDGLFNLKIRAVETCPSVVSAPIMPH
jgi:hypothetical protein